MFQCLLVLACLALVQAMPGGAPRDACSDFRPRHGTSVEQNGTTPYLVLAALSFSDDLGYFYEPETMYKVGVFPRDNVTGFYRGFLVQVVTMADGSPVGRFLNLPSDINGTNAMAIEGVCEGSATHMYPASSNRDTREPYPHVLLDWMSPPAGTGPIRFRYSVVVDFDTWYADDFTDVVAEGGAEKITGMAVLIASMIFLSVALI